MFGFSLRPRKAASANTAKERLQILLAHERSGAAARPDCLPQLQREILDVIRRHMQIGDEAIDIRMERGDELSSLEINIEFPGKLGVN
ncbi:cell division topological specificity factor MinE [Leisingera sp. JC1]|jgi:cell division topological specificity factor|uniref:cell division topological specificity factor MinE n=1 Tax=Leisingera sp. JC1 TaxID=1855282 RepID=UPI0008037C3C|nr:cell division topological specificity factor MinE [Leisingera sp. JC1]OBY24959.1 cell division topological specificity factor MinE [Leisingera sp. JC1]